MAARVRVGVRHTVERLEVGRHKRAAAMSDRRAAGSQADMRRSPTSVSADVRHRRHDEPTLQRGEWWTGDSVC